MILQQKFNYNKNQYKFQEKNQSNRTQTLQPIGPHLKENLSDLNKPDNSSSDNDYNQPLSPRSISQRINLQGISKVLNPYYLTENHM